MDILIAPTVREGLSLSILEAMACGLPVITSNISSMPEQIKDGMGGILCEPRDPMAFANAINELSSNEILAQSMGQFNLERVRSKFNINETIYKYNDIFSHL
jgi:glycosyltransferase involved in cell wall biosynthesis